ncbi:unnamed protein product [Brassica oleracea var. botrytis]|uniref:Armadillo repeat-containing domain-containing protein n=1 Tax=Brassica oleracea TaxID=3712 RepID=A0A3P6BHQ5_BRAOL|nr:unnamed protein product [Brassica oleracea]
MAIPVVPYTMVKLSRAVSKKQRTIRCQCLECDSSGEFKRSLFKKVHIAQRGAITPLIKMLQSSDEQVVEMSAFALGRLAQALDTHNQAGIGQRGGIISLLNLLDVNTGSENLADFIKAGGIQRLQDDNFTVQPTRDCVVRTLKRLDNKIHGPVLNQLLYLMRTTEKTIQRRIDLALAHICDPKDGKLISLITMHERADILLETFNRIEKLLPVHQRAQLLPHPPTATGKKTSFFQV